MSLIPHGGRLNQAERRHPNAPRPFLDLSTGINPEAYPFTPPGLDAWTRLPEPEAIAILEAAAAFAYGVHDPAMVVAAAGTEALIKLLPRVLPLSRIAIVAPTYAEHAVSWRAAGTTVRHVTAPERPASLLCNPNNPDGVVYSPTDLETLAAGMKLLIVDEAFADFEPGISLASRLPLPGVVVLRSFGKSYGLAGLRLGFALATPDVADRLRDALGPWPVSGPAIEIGTEALSDLRWRDAASVRAHAATDRLGTLLLEHGLQILGGTALFRTAETPRAAALADFLGGAGILVRSFERMPTWLRFGLPAGESAWARLAAALEAWRNPVNL